MLFRYDDCVRLLRDPAASVEDRRASTAEPGRSSASDPGDRASGGTRRILNLDPPDHTRIRRLVAEGLHAPRASSSSAPACRSSSTVARRGRVARGDGDFDVIADLAFPLPSR